LVEHRLEHIHMQGIRRYTHADRRQVIEELLPLIQRKFGANLVAVAASVVRIGERGDAAGSCSLSL
jgi:hypothetical protein